MLPSRMFFDDFFDGFELPRKLDKMMKCDIYEKDDKYILEMDIPGFKKEDINMEFENGYLKVFVEKNLESSEKEEKKYVRRERNSYAKYERSFYIGDVSLEEIKAKFKDGILEISVPKEKDKKEERKIIMIED